MSEISLPTSGRRFGFRNVRVLLEDNKAPLVRKSEGQVGLTTESTEIPTLRFPPRGVFQPRKNREVTVRRTLRLNAEVNERLEELSKRRNTSTNILANKALRGERGTARYIREALSEFSMELRSNMAGRPSSSNRSLQVEIL